MITDIICHKCKCFNDFPDDILYVFNAFLCYRIWEGRRGQRKNAACVARPRFSFDFARGGGASPSQAFGYLRMRFLRRRLGFRRLSRRFRSENGV